MLVGSYDFAERQLSKGLGVQITLALPPDIEVRLRESVARGDVETVRWLLTKVLADSRGIAAGNAH